jgi:peptide/nickel transport system substrate-binding protein
MLREVGMDVEYVGVDYGTLLTRRNRKTPVAEGGWSAFSVNWQGIDWLNPAGHIGLRGDGGYPGWYVSEKMESLRAQWLLAEGLAEQQRICREIEQLAVQDVPYYRQPTAHRSTVAGILSGTAVFWNVHPA